MPESDGQKFEMSFDAWGNRRNADTWENYTTSLPGFVIDRGFTGHEHLDEFGLINMNGRVYDPVVARFLSPDPYIQAPNMPQNYNGYVYCLNNPLVYTDPDGEIIIIPMLIGAGISVLTNGINNSINGDPFFEGAGKAAIIGGISGAFAFGIGQAASGMSGFGKLAFQTMAHGHLGGVMSGMNGGTYGMGFLSGAAGSLSATGTGLLLNGSGKAIEALGVVGGGAVAGGIGAKIAGGNFWDGARTGAISAGLNHGIHSGLFGDGLMIASITGRTRHLFGPDAISLAGTVDGYSGIGVGIEKGGLILLRGEEAGIYGFNDLGVGVGGLTISAGTEVVKLYSSAQKVMKSHFYGPRYEANLSFTVANVNIGGTSIYARHSEGFTIGYGVTLGIDAMPFNIGFNFNRGASGQNLHQLTNELRKAIHSW